MGDHARATDITDAMKIAAAVAIAGAISHDELSADCVVPSVFDREVAFRVAAAAVAGAATSVFV